jgi:hypothetical protein
MLVLSWLLVTAAAAAPFFALDDEEHDVDLSSFYGQPDASTGDRVAAWRPYLKVFTFFVNSFQCHEIYRCIELVIDFSCDLHSPWTEIPGTRRVNLENEPSN